MQHLSVPRVYGGAYQHIPPKGNPTMSRFRFLLLGVLFLAAVPAQAQRITFNDAVRIALEQNLTLQRSENSVQQQEISVASAKSTFLPSLNSNASASKGWGLSFDQTSGRLVTTSSESASFGASTSLNLFNGFADVARLEQAENNLAAQKESLNRARQTVVFNVIQSYLQLLVDREQIAIREEDLSAQQKQLERIQEFVRVGSRPVADLYQQQASVASSEAALLSAQRAIQLDEARLIQVMQLDPLGDYTFETTSSDEVPLVLKQYDINELLRNALDQRADLKAQQFSINAAEQSIRIAKSGYLPTIGLSGSVRTSYSSNRQESFSDQFSNNRSQSVGLSLNLPLFDRFSTKHSIESSRVQLSNSKYDLENLQQSVALDVRQAYLDYQTAAKRLEVTEKQLQAAKQALDVEQERYEVGVSTLVELTQARSTYTSAAGQRVQAIFQFHFQHKIIDYYQGILDPTTVLF